MAEGWQLTVSTYSWHPDEGGLFRQRPSCEGGGWSDGRRASCGGAAAMPKNKETFGAGIGYRLTERTDVLVGAYRNSEWHTSRYAMATWRIHRHAFLAGGYLDGYARTPVGGALVVEVGPARIVAVPTALSLWFAFGV